MLPSLAMAGCRLITMFNAMLPLYVLLSLVSLSIWAARLAVVPWLDRSYTAAWTMGRSATFSAETAERGLVAATADRSDAQGEGICSQLPIRCYN